MYKLIRKLTLAGLGLQARANEVLEGWVKEGERNPQKEAQRVREFLGRFEKDAEAIEKKMGDLCRKVASRMDLSSREELKRLSKKIDELASRFEQVQKGR